jgi:hypothetical protein
VHVNYLSENEKKEEIVMECKATTVIVTMNSIVLGISKC